MNRRLHGFVVGGGLRPGRPSRSGAFLPDARHFLKQVANRLPLKVSNYAIMGRPASEGRPAEAVLRSGTLLLVVTDSSDGVYLQLARCEPGVTVKPDDWSTYTLDEINAPGRTGLLDACRAILAMTSDSRPQTIKAA